MQRFKGKNHLPNVEDDPEGKEHPSKVNNGGNSQREIILIILLSLISHVSYWISLEGQPEWQTKEQREDWIHEKLFKLSISLLLSVICFSLVFILFVFSLHSLSLRFKLFYFLIYSVSQITLILSDDGVSAWHHGWFNAIAFLLFTFPIIMTSLCILIFKKILPPHLFKKGFYFIIFLNRWNKGLWGQEMIMNEKCTFNLPSINWMEIPPAGSLNFWTGSQVCSSTPRIAHFEGSNLVLDGCPIGSKAHLTIFPRVELDLFSIPFEDRTDQDVLQHQILFARKNVTWKVSQDQIVPRSIVDPNVESVEVKCSTGSNLLVRNIPLTKQELQASKKKLSSKHHDVLNILVLYYDAVSRRHFMRRFPKMTEWLEGPAMSYWEGFQFFRYSAVGTNTRPNSLRMFLSNETKKTYWTHFQENGYLTAILDNSCTDWSAKYAHLPSKPDFHFFAPFCSEIARPLNNPEGAFRGPFAMTKRCYMGRHNHDYLFDYAKQFWIDHHPDYLKMMMISFNEAHEPTGEVIGQVDVPSRNFLNMAFEKGALNDTVIFIVSDHGLHMGPSYQFHLYSSVLEARLPLMISLWPRDWLARHPKLAENLKNNQQRMHTGGEWLQTLLALSRVSKNPQTLSSFPLSVSNYFPSLFDDIPSSRTCQEAHIPNLVCLCGDGATPNALDDEHDLDFQKEREEMLKRKRKRLEELKE